MRITHPQATFRGIPAEDTFFASNEQHIQLGTGYLIPFVQKELYPARPLNIYMEIDSQPSARNLLFGALLARAIVIRDQNYPGMPARLYAQLDASDADLVHFYQHSGLTADDAEDLFYFPLPYAEPGKTPMGVQYASVPLENDAQQDAFLQRLNAMRISPIQRDQLTLWREQPGFLALGFYRAGRPVSELVTAGTGPEASLVQVYTRAEYRHQGMARSLVLQASAILRERGIQGLYAHIFRRNTPQVAFMQSIGATYTKTIALLPGVDL